jgi:hypothetical protein
MLILLSPDAIKMLQPVPNTKEKNDDQTFRLLNITEKGLEELQPNPQQII